MPQIPGGASGAQTEYFSKDLLEREISNLVDQHNVKVQKVNCAIGIINTLHLFYQSSKNSEQEFERMTIIVK